MLQKPGLSSGLMGHVARTHTLPLQTSAYKCTKVTALFQSYCLTYKTSCLVTFLLQLHRWFAITINLYYNICQLAHKFFTGYFIADVETEDDEVSVSVLKVKAVTIPEDLVPALTDKTFDVIKNENDLLVVDFFQPCKCQETILQNCFFLVKSK